MYRTVYYKSFSPCPIIKQVKYTLNSDVCKLGAVQLHVCACVLMKRAQARDRLFVSIHDLLPVSNLGGVKVDSLRSVSNSGFR